ncbi:nuclear transport factor 2 family protein [Roseivirga misakiensis]|uniref:SnoaL-like domain-containing protein n=1 Tax=Roseivirga misakiensis TaxID=1563681 RepID=A0A1E5SZ47_9BACT|nr:nuclear transport factor 2 family protein [Roseivirga misakiensis]OEK04391.1 hypothetical protein BFP71_12990 [Roseivirga misakiensis]
MTLLKLLILMSFHQAQTPEQVVQKQLDTYNARDIDRFMSVMDKNVALFNFSDGKLLAQGEKEVRELYTNLFEKSPKLNSVLKNRIVLGHQVIDHELITGRMGSQDLIELVVIYEVKDELIYKITVMRKNG